jgi:hypothetical protein
MTVHMETVYAADKNVTGFDVSWIRTTVPWIARMPPMSTSLVWTATNILWMGEEFRRNQQTRRTPVQPPYRISRFSDISLNDVLYFHDCAHGDRSTPTRMSRVSTFPGFRTTVPWIVLMPRTTSRDWTKLPLYFLWLEKNPAESNSRMPVTTVQNIPDSPDISLNDVSFTSMTAHGDSLRRG